MLYSIASPNGEVVGHWEAETPLEALFMMYAESVGEVTAYDLANAARIVGSEHDSGYSKADWLIKPVTMVCL
ncbi:MAG: hypothetical protein HQL73_07685 [Magnetococcales bacterium]|nr:hypothetical protein [Magnetococcales bacterium]